MVERRSRDVTAGGGRISQPRILLDPKCAKSRTARVAAGTEIESLLFRIEQEAPTSAESTPSEAGKRYTEPVGCAAVGAAANPHDHLTVPQVAGGWPLRAGWGKHGSGNGLVQAWRKTNGGSQKETAPSLRGHLHKGAGSKVQSASQPTWNLHEQGRNRPEGRDKGTMGADNRAGPPQPVLSCSGLETKRSAAIRGSGGMTGRCNSAAGGQGVVRSEWGWPLPR